MRKRPPPASKSPRLSHADALRVWRRASVAERAEFLKTIRIEIDRRERAGATTSELARFTIQRFAEARSVG